MLTQDLLPSGVPVIDNTKDETYYRQERAERDKENLAKHMFVENAEVGKCNLDPDTHAVRRRISFDFVYFQHETLPSEYGEAQEVALQKRVAEQVLKVISGF